MKWNARLNAIRGLGALLAATAVVGIAGKAFAQTGDGQVKHNCSADAGNSPGKDLSEKLDDCNGVLKPPKVGDSELVEPHKPTGTMPVIKPGDLRPHQNP